MRTADFFQGVFTEVNETLAVLKPDLVSKSVETPRTETPQ